MKKQNGLQEKKDLLKAVLRGEITVEKAFISLPDVLITTLVAGVYKDNSNGRLWSREKINEFQHTVFILPDNGRNI